MPDLLFIYGTLHPDRAPAAIAVTTRLLKPVGRAVIRGRRYELGEYPGVVLADESTAVIEGDLFLLPEDPAGSVTLARLDAYEDFRLNDLANSLFLRQRALATLEDGSQRECWVYTYNLPLPENR